MHEGDSICVLPYNWNLGPVKHEMFGMLELMLAGSFSQYKFLFHAAGVVLVL